MTVFHVKGMYFWATITFLHLKPLGCFFCFEPKKVFDLLKTKQLVSQTVAKTQTLYNVRSPVSTVEGLVLTNSNKASDWEEKSSLATGRHRWRYIWCLGTRATRHLCCIFVALCLLRRETWWGQIWSKSWADKSSWRLLFGVGRVGVGGKMKVTEGILLWLEKKVSLLAPKAGCVVVLPVILDPNPCAVSFWHLYPLYSYI